jgi:hypothetical protein
MIKSHRVTFALLLPFGLMLGCASGGSEKPSKAEAPAEAPEAAPAVPIPADSPFAKVQLGMNMDEVNATIGQPTSSHSYATGKAWIPFHFGGDNARLEAHYKGTGRLTFSQKSAFTSDMKLLRVDYDPNEPGFHRDAKK